MIKRRSVSETNTLTLFEPIQTEVDPLDELLTLVQYTDLVSIHEMDFR